MDDQWVSTRPTVTELAELLVRKGYLDNELDARRAVKRLIEEVNKMGDHEDGKTGGR